MSVTVDVARGQRSVISHLIESGWEIIDDGRHRITFGRGGYVVKVPLCPEYESYNQREHQAYWRNQDPRYARCRFIRIRGVGCLIMERLEDTITPSHFYHHIDKSAIPDWADKVDCFQIGRSREDGSWKCFDYPEDPLYD